LETEIHPKPNQREASMQAKQLVVKAGNHNRENCPLGTILQIPPAQKVNSVWLQEKSSNQIVPVQWERNKEKLHLCWILDNLTAGETKEYQVAISEKEKEPGKGVRLLPVDDQRVEIWTGDELFTAYHFGPEVVRPFLYPLIGPGGKHLTRPLARKQDKDMDHHHHRSYWVAYGDVNGVDNWLEGEEGGKTLHRIFETLKEGPVFAQLCAKGDWVSPAGKKILEEQRVLKFYNLSDCRIIDMELALKATQGEVKFGDTKEGGVASLRVMPSMEVRNGGKIENSYGGINEAETWGKRAHWCDYSGQVEGESVGITLFDHPDNFRYPTWWHVRDYGLMTANPFALSYYTGDPNNRGDYLLPQGEELQFYFRLYIHRGDASAGKVGKRYHDYINPPEVEVH
jgi:hypothetical protein